MYKTTEAARATVARYNQRHPDRVKASRKKSREDWKARDPDGYRAYRKKSDLARKGLTVHEFARLLAAQQNCCAICSGDFGAHGPQVDHAHSCCPGLKSCGKCVRGLLCHHCNMGLGRFFDDPLRLHSAIRYLT